MDSGYIFDGKLINNFISDVKGEIMRKIILLLIGFIMLTGTIWANGSKEKTIEDGKIHLKGIYQLNITDDLAVKNWNQIWPAFQEKFPNIEIEWEFISDEAYHDKLQTMAVSNQLPDLILLWPKKRTGMVTGTGKIKDLSPWIKGHESEFSSEAMSPQGLNEEMYELPEQVNICHTFYINERLLKKLGLTIPKTYEELLAQGDVIREADLIPIAMDNGDGWPMDSCFLSTLAERTGGEEWLLRAVKGDNSGFADKEFVDALNIIKTISDNNMFSPGINSSPCGIALDAFIREEAVYLIDGGWRVQNLRSELTEEQMEYISISTFPDIPNQVGESGSTAAVAGTGFGMNSKLEGGKAEAAWEWIWFWAGPDGSKIKTELGWMPAYKMEPSDNLPLISKKYIKYSKDLPMSPVIDAFMDGEGVGILNSAIQEMMLGTKSPLDVATEYETWVKANDSNRK